MLRVADCIADSVRLAIPQATERQRIGDEINAAMILACPNFVKVLELVIAPVPIILALLCGAQEDRIRCHEPPENDHYNPSHAVRVTRAG
jgi:hypothetical protein